MLHQKIGRSVGEVSRVTHRLYREVRVLSALYINFFVTFGPFLFLAIFRNEIMTILIPSTSEGVIGEVGVVTFFVLDVPDYESTMLIYFYICVYIYMCVCVVC